MRDLNVLNDYRIDLFGDGECGDNTCGAFIISIEGVEYFAIASAYGDWEHVSISNINNVPSWEVMCKMKYIFFEDEEVVMQLHPKKSDYVNIHPNCLHLWKPTYCEIPTPPCELV